MCSQILTYATCNRAEPFYWLCVVRTYDSSTLTRVQPRYALRTISACNRGPPLLFAETVGRHQPGKDVSRLLCSDVARRAWRWWAPAPRDPAKKGGTP